MILLQASLVLLAVAAVAGWQFAPPRRSLDGLLRSRLKHRFVVTLESGESFTGLLSETDARSLTLRDVSVMKQDGAVVPVDGELILRRDAVAFMQRPTG